jgi:hypothetical protein
MARSLATPLARQVSRVRRRLFLQSLLERLIGFWVVAIVSTMAWFLVQFYLVPEAPTWLRWSVFGGLMGAATLASVSLAILRAPSPVVAALALDQHFNLKERVTTSLTLAPNEAASPAGIALLADVNVRLEPLRVSERFPLRLPRSALLIPLGVGVLLLLAFFYKPLTGSLQADTKEPLAQTPAVKAEIDQKLRPLKKDPAKKPDNRPKSKELEHLEAELDKLAQKPHETKVEARDVVKDMAQLEDQIKKREKDLAERAEALKAQMKQVERVSKKDKKDGPAKDLDKALEQGDLKKARDEVERLAQRLKDQGEMDRLRKKLEDKKLNEQERREAQEQLDKLKDQELTREQKEQMQDQLKDLKDNLERLTRKKDQEDRLRDLARKGELDPDQLQRELEQLEKNADKLEQDLQQLQELAAKIAECQKCMQEGKDGEAAQKLEEAAAELAKLDPNDEGIALAQKLQQLQEARRAMCQALDNNPAQASGRRPLAKEGETQAKEERSRSQMGKGRMQVIDQVPGEGFKGPRRPAEMAEDIRRARQEAPEAIDRQRLPRGVSDMAKGYFQNLRGKELDKAKVP